MSGCTRGSSAEELKRFGIDRPREWIHGELDWLAEMGAVTLLKPGSVVVATLTEKGHRHLRRAIVIARASSAPASGRVNHGARRSWPAVQS